MTNNIPTGTLYLIPITLGDTTNPMDVLPQTVKRAIEMLDIFIVENEKQQGVLLKASALKKNNQSLFYFL